MLKIEIWNRPWNLVSNKRFNTSLKTAILFCGLGALLGSGSVRAQTNMSIPVSGGSGNLTYTVTTSVNGSCPVSQPPSSYQNVTQTSFSNFTYNGITESGSALSYISVSSPNSYCPPVGWQGPIPLPLSPQANGNTYYILFYPPAAPNFTQPGTASMDALNLSVSANPAIWGKTLQITARETFPNLSGTVTFLDGSSTIGTASMSNSVATFPTSTLEVGTHTLSATFTSMAGTVTTPSLSLTVNKATPTVTWANPGAITYGTPLSSTQLGATASVGGTFSYSPSFGTVLGVGSHTLSVTFTPTDTTHYNTVNSSVSISVNRATLTVTANNASRTYGSANPAFSASYSGFVNGDTTSVLSGSPSLTTTATTSSGAGSYTIGAAQGSLSASNYQFSFVNGTLTVNKATLTVRANNASRIYGSANPAFTASYTGFVNGDTTGVLSGSPSLTTTATASSPVASYTITAAQGNLLAGNYQFSFVNGTLTVTKATPIVTWSAPPAITYGTALNGTQLSATSSALGTFSYSPAAGTVLSAGAYTLSTTFTPSDTSDYTSASASVSLTVDKATVNVTADNKSRAYGAQNPSLTATFAGFVNGDTQSVVSGAPSLSTAATTSSSPANYTISVSVSSLSASNYVFNPVNGTLTVTKAIPTITWSQPSPMSNGTKLTTLQLDAVGSVPGTFVYSPAAGTALSSGTQTLSTTFTPNDNADYAIATASTTIKILSGAKSDSGTVTLSIGNGSSYSVVATTTYGAGANPSTVAEGLADGVVSGSPVKVTATDDQLFIQANTAGSATDYPYIIQTTTWDSADFSQPSFAYPSIMGSLDGGADSSTAGSVLYSYQLGYDADGNVNSDTDSLTGNWTYTYDTLDRLAGGSTTQTGNPTPNYCWSYDPFGNRTQQEASSLSFQSGSGGPTSCQPQSGGTLATIISSYGTDNRVASTNARGTNSVPYYDDAGNMMTDGVNSYLYDADGRICAVASTAIDGMTILTGYLYDADGVRIGKGSISAWSCDPTVNGYQPLQDFVIGSSGAPVSEVGVDSDDGTLTAQRTYVYAGGKLIATYNPDGLHFRATDWLGSLRASTDAQGTLQSNSSTLPFGDQFTATGNPADKYDFTGKERDAESGNDYFGARYYSSSMGRWMSPDPSVLDFADLSNPQSLNLYSYVLNNPLKFTDIDGLVCHWDDGTQDDLPENGGATWVDCLKQGGTWSEDVTINVKADDNGNQLSVMQTDSSGIFIDFRPGAECSTALAGANKTAQAINNYYGKYKGVVSGAANAHGIDANLLAALGVRESGFRNSVQPGGAGRGIFQIDLGQHPDVSFSQAMDPSFSANYAAGMLQSGYTSAASLGYGHDMSNAGALRQYNAGPRYFKQKMAGGVTALDKGTTGANHGPGNYVSNVLAISTKCF